jgi:hypothetical protein
MIWSAATGDILEDALHPHAHFLELRARRTYDALGNPTCLRDPNGDAFDLTDRHNTLASTTNHATGDITKYADPRAIAQEVDGKNTTLYLVPLELANGRRQHYRAGDRRSRARRRPAHHYTQDYALDARHHRAVGRVERYDYLASVASPRARAS